jgi:hypothetical protein
VLRRILLSILALLAAGLLAAGWYAYHKGFTQKWRRVVASEFRKRGVELSLRRLTLEPFRGLVAKDVTIYDGPERKRAIAVVDEVLLVVNYANLIQGKTSIDALDLRDANLDVPLNPSKRQSARLEIRHLSGRLFLPPRQVYLSRLDAELYGMKLRASGRLINPQVFPIFPNKKTAAREQAAEIAEAAIAQLKALTLDGAAVQLDVQFSGDLAEPGKISIETTLWAENVRRGNYRLETLYLDGGIRDGVARLRQLVANDKGGVLRAAGSYDFTNREGSVELQSGLDAQSLVRAFRRIEELDEAVIYAPPEISLTMRGSFADKPRWQALGHVRLKKFAYKSVMFDGFNTDFSWDGERWAALDVHLLHRSGELSGDVMQSPAELRSRLRSSISEKAFAPLRSGKTGEWVRRLEIAGAG